MIKIKKLEIIKHFKFKNLNPNKIYKNFLN